MTTGNDVFKAIVADISPFIVKGGWFPSRQMGAQSICRREPATFNNKGTDIGYDGLEDIIASCHYRDILIIILITYMLFVCI